MYHSRLEKVVLRTSAAVLLFAVFSFIGCCAGEKIGQYFYKTKTVQASVLYKDSNVKHDTQDTEEDSNNAQASKKIAYLTFDDGPSPNVTPQILDILDKNKIKATFFVVGSMARTYKDVLKKEKSEGHLIGNHSFSHEYHYLYSGVSNFTGDIQKCDDTIESITGSDDSKLLRFPGGTIGQSKMKPYVDASKKLGYTYIDWNCETGDAERNNVPVDELLKNLSNTSRGKKDLIVLMHDLSTKETTVKALPKVIKYLKLEGYTFRSLKNFKCLK